MVQVIENGVLRDLRPGETLPSPPSVEDWRINATLDKVTFLNRAADMGLITDDEAIAAASGTWPESFNVALPADSAQARAAKVLWAGTPTIRRNAPLIAAIIASPIPITADQVDALFGWTG